ncbi:helix-turn-helix transcriptional regulator [Eggerthella lenta]|uniref:Helix-turn-helix transcriptional regulator n=1 Tax=Eggerthella lenta TaxID=84112 RepID=A0A5C5BRI6_EGGLN|nr:helix-turn-helix transcriptional regulator [Eggerthella lenta]TNU89038.1 helix-turn-helix transcriptional regulator [Eggerthella lenta]
MTRIDESFEPTIDLSLYGALLKRARLNLGYRRAEDFVAAMKCVTGYDVSKDIVYRMENGKKEPTINFMIAMNLMLGLPATDFSMAEMCIPKEWNDLSESRTKHDFDTEKWNIGLEVIPF